MRSYEELVVADAAWPEVRSWIEASDRAELLLRDRDSARECLMKLQVTTRSTLGALAHETGGLLFDHGWLRMFGSGHPRLQRALGAWNAELAVSIADFLFVADDIVGGVFAINGGALGPVQGNVYYFAPDRLAWEDLGLRHSEFVRWTCEGDLDRFYATMRWSGWQDEVAKVAGDSVLSLYPPLWSREGQDISKVSRRAIAAREAWQAQQEFVRQLGLDR